jgi:hypothetical protein
MNELDGRSSRHSAAVMSLHRRSRRVPALLLAAV